MARHTSCVLVFICFCVQWYRIGAVMFTNPPLPYYNVDLYENTPLLSFVFTMATDDPTATIDCCAITPMTHPPKLRFLTPNMIIMYANVDYETDNTTYDVEMWATTDPYIFTSTATVQFKFADVNEGPEISGTLTGNVNENELINTPVSGISLVATDPEGDPFTYHLDSTTYFTIDSATGQISTNLVLDYESQTSYVVGVYAKDDSGVSGSTVYVTINVNDVNDNPPSFSSSTYTATIAENTGSGQSVAELTVSDPDTVGTVTLAIVSGDDTHAKFTLSSNTIQTTNRQINYEQLSGSGYKYILLVTADDTVGVVTATVTVSITGVNEFTPSWSTFIPAYVSATTPYTVDENVGAGTSIVTIAATDSDHGTDGQIIYTLSDPVTADNGDSVSGLFQMNANTGELSTTGSTLDRDPATGGYEYFDVTVMAADQGSPSLSVNRVMRISLNDLNDNAPVCGQVTYTTSVDENDPISTVVVTVVATDDDVTSANNVVTYSVTGGTGASDFSVNTNTGVVSTSSSLDYEAGTTSYEVQITAQDGGSPVLSTTCTVQITLNDLNDNTPSFSPATLTTSISEASSTGATVTTVIATDSDSSTNNNNVIAYSFSTVSALFNIGSVNGVVTLAAALDRESVDSHTLVIHAADQGSPTNTGTLTLTVSVTDTNDNTPIFTSTSYSFNIAESASISALYSIGQVQASDADIGSNALITFTINSAISGNVSHFHVNPSTGDVTHIVTLDRESISLYELEILATDSGSPPLTGSSTLTIVIDDVNDNTPAFTSLAYSFNVIESTTSSTTIGQVQASDADIGSNAVITFAISTVLSGTGGHFNLNSATGDVTITASLDRETTALYKFRITATDGGSPPLTVTSTLTIVIDDANDNPPTFTSTPYSYNIDESASISTTVGQVQASDADVGSNAAITFTINSAIIGNMAHFNVNPTTGEVTNVATLDRESIPLYELEILATDGGSPALTGTSTFTIIVDDANDNSPTFTSTPYSFNVAESASTSTSVGQVQASDADIGSNAVILFTIDSAIVGNVAHFNLNPTTGEVTNTVTLDRESISLYELEILATDGGSPPLTGTSTLTIVIDDVNDNTPTFTSTPFTFNVIESVTASTTIGQVQASDADIGSNAAITFAISTVLSGTGGHFNLNPTTGDVTITASLDRETTSLYKFRITATDGGSPPLTVTSTLTIVIDDANDNTPTFTATPYSCNIDESASISTSVGLVHASDTDVGSNAAITFSINSAITGNMAHFNVNPTTGEVINVATLDRESISLYELEILATDGGSPTLTGTSTFTIIVDDVNDNVPVFDLATYTVSTTENQPISTSIVTVTVNDADVNTNALFTLSIDTSTANGTLASTYLQINTATGLLSVIQTIDRETHQSFEFYLVAIDHGSPALTSSASVFVSVADVNDNTPVFTSTAYSFNVSESATISTSVGQAQASDADIGINSAIMFAISTDISGNSAHFNLDPTTGNVTVSVNLDRETISMYEFEITATDAGSPVLTATSTMIIFIDDVNDNAPVFDLVSYSVSTTENQPVTTSVLTVTVSDADLGTNSLYSLSIDTSTTNGTLANTYLHIDTATGLLSVIQTIDRETHPSFEFYIVAIDQGTPALTSSASVSVSVTDVNDNSPSFDLTTYTFNISEASILSTVVGQVHASDPDDGVNALITYTINSFTIGNGTHFFLDNTTGVLTTFSGLDREIYDVYELTIIVTDGGTIPNTDTCTVTIYIDDENDNVPIFDAASYNVNSAENSVAGTSILTLTLTDYDIGLNGDILLSIDTSTPDGARADLYVQVDSATSLLSVKQSIDRETDHSFSFTVVAIDQGSPALNSSADIYISIDDLNDNNPIFNQTDYLFNVSEAVSIGTLSGTVMATDVDIGQNTNLTYTIEIVPTGDSLSFALDPVSGIITTAANLDRETTDLYVMIVAATDAGTNPLNHTATVTIAIMDENDNAPAFSDVLYEAYVVENSIIGTSILYINVTDADIGVNSDMILNINTPMADGAHADLYIDVNSTSMILSVKQLIDRQTDANFIFTLIATDQGIPALASTAVVNITVNDTNDNPPIFSPSFYSTEIAYNDHCQGTIATVTATDADVGINSMITFTASSPYNTSLFMLDGANGEVTYVNTTDVDSKYLIYVIAYDGGTPQLNSTSEAIVRIDTYDPNDVILVYYMDMDCVNYLANETTFLTQLSDIYNSTYPTSYARRWCYMDGSDSGTCIVHVYVIANNTADDVSELNNTKYFIHADDAITFTAQSEAGTFWSNFSITRVKKYAPVTASDDDSGVPWVQTPAGIAALTILSLVGVGGVAAVIATLMQAYANQPELKKKVRQLNRELRKQRREERRKKKQQKKLERQNKRKAKQEARQAARQNGNQSFRTNNDLTRVSITDEGPLETDVDFRAEIDEIPSTPVSGSQVRILEVEPVSYA